MLTKWHLSVSRDPRDEGVEERPWTRLLRRTGWLSLLLAVLVCDGARTVHAADYTLDDVKRGYRASLGALNPLWTRCKLTKIWKIENPELGRVNPGSDEGDTVEWAIDGAQFHYQWQAPNHYSWFSCDGNSIWELDYGFAERGDPPNEIKCAQRQSLQTKTDARLRSSINPGQWLGLYFNAGSSVQSGESVSSILDKPSATFIGNELVEGRTCVRVNLVYRMLNGKETPAHVWFDPSAGFLPRRIVVIRTNSTSDYLVEAFRSFPSGHGGSVFLPSQMRCDTTVPERPTRDRTCTLIIESARVGERLEPSLFKPTLPAGVPVFNMDRKEERLAWQNYLARETPEERQARLEDMKKKTASRLEPHALPAGLKPDSPAVASSGWSWPTILFVVGIVLLVLASVSSARR